MARPSTYRVRFRKDGKTLIDAAQAKKALIVMLYERHYLSEEREGKLFFSRVEDFHEKHWPKTQVEISETDEFIDFAFSLSSLQLFFLLPGGKKRLERHVEKEMLPEWSHLKV